MLKHTKTLLVLGFLLTNTFNLLAQQDIIIAWGTVKDDRSFKKMEGVEVVLEEDGKQIKALFTPINGKFELDLNYDHDYNIRFNKPGYVSKFINVDTRNVPEEDKVGGAGFDLDMALFLEIEGINFDILKKPVGIAKYNPSAGGVEFDYEYTKSIADAIAKLRKQLEEKYKEEEEALQAEMAASALEQSNQDNFDQLVKEGDEQFAASNFANAVFKYADALDIMPGVKYVEDKLKKAQEALDAQRASEELEAKYTAAIEIADKAFAKEEFAGAITSYQEASGLKPTEQYPKDQITAAQKRLDELANKEKNEAEYATLITSADAKFTAKDYLGAIDEYKEASGIKSAEQYPKDQIAEAQARIKNIKDIQEQYDKYIASADKKFGSDNLEAALLDYQAAAKLKDVEKYPKTQIEIIKAKLGEIADAQAQTEKYNTLVADADKQYFAGDYTGAIATYNKALVIKAGEQYPKDQIVAANAKLSEIADQEEVNRKYKELIASADASFKDKDYETAIINYKAASQLKEKEQYPKDQLSEAVRLLKARQDQKAIDAQYKEIIAAADAKFNGNDFKGSIADYKQALTIKPTEQYPKDQIVAAEAKLQNIEAQAAIDKQYEKLIASADGQFDSEKYSEAIADYKAALALKSAEVYPKNQIQLAEDRLKNIADKAAKDAQYDAFIKKGDAFMGDESWGEAITAYQGAVLIRNEKYPNDQIAKAQGKLGALLAAQELQEKYEALIVKADGEFTGTKYEEAIATYRQALAVKGKEQYPKDQINLAEKNLEALMAEEEKDARYFELLAQSDNDYASEKYGEAISNYESALNIKPTEQYPKDQILAINKLMGELDKEAAEEERFKQLVAKADGEFTEEKYTEAIATYGDALKIRDRPYPKDQITKAQTALNTQKKQKELNAQYNALVADGDAKLTGKSFENAIIDYEAALEIKPTEQYPKDQITKAKQSIADLKDAKKREAAYKSAIAYGDEQMDAKNYSSAITSYENASSLKPDEQYPLDRIAEANKALREIDLAAATEQAGDMLDNTVDVPDEPAERRVSSFQDIVTTNDIPTEPAEPAEVVEVKDQNPVPKVMYKLSPDSDDESFRGKLGANYPEGLTEEKYIEGNKTIYRSIYVQNKMGDEYLKVEARFGMFFFKNGSSITSLEHKNFITSVK